MSFRAVCLRVGLWLPRYWRVLGRYPTGQHIGAGREMAEQAEGAGGNRADGEVADLVDGRGPNGSLGHEDLYLAGPGRHDLPEQGVGGDLKLDSEFHRSERQVTQRRRLGTG